MERSHLLSAKLSLVAKVKSPFTSDGFKQCMEKMDRIQASDTAIIRFTVTWVSQADAKISPGILTAPVPQSNTLRSCKRVSAIEYELGLLAQKSSYAVLADNNFDGLASGLWNPYGSYPNASWTWTNIPWR